MRNRFRPLRFEPLEVRQLLDAAGLTALISPAWFQSVSDASQLAHAGTAAWTAESTAGAIDRTVSLSDDASQCHDWIVQFDTAALAGIDSAAETAALLADADFEFQVLRGLGMEGLTLVRSTGASIGAVRDYLSQNVFVAAFEQDAIGWFEVASNDPKSGQLWGLSQIDAQEAWSLSTGSRSVVVAVIDTGVDYTHIDLAANIWTNPGEIAGNGIDDDGNGFIDDVHGYDFANRDGNPMDDNGHGTHVAGTIAAVGNNSVGVTGVNWSSSIMCLKFLGADGSGYLSDAVAAINYATMMRTIYGVNVRVDNNSWGGAGTSQALDNAIRASNDAGILFVAAAGNDKSNNDVSSHYPANAASPNVISVAACDRNDNLASFSNYGAVSVDIAAPGVSIYSTVPGNRYAIYSGTSMAAPHVAGVAALAWALNPDATVAEVRAAILDGADPVASLAGKVASGGRLNAHQTLLTLAKEDSPPPTVTSLGVSAESVMQGVAVTFTARGISSSSAVVGAYLYRDANGNGAYDAADALVGSTTTIADGRAVWSVDTAKLPVGSHRFFVRVVNADSVWSDPVGVSLTITARNTVPSISNIGDRVMPVGQNTMKIIVAGTDADGDVLRYSAQIFVPDPRSPSGNALIDREVLVPYAGSRVTASMAGNILTINRLSTFLDVFYVRVTVSDGIHSVVQTFRVAPAAAAAKVAFAANAATEAAIAPYASRFATETPSSNQSCAECVPLERLYGAVLCCPISPDETQADRDRTAAWAVASDPVASNHPTASWLMRWTGPAPACPRAEDVWNFDDEDATPSDRGRRDSAALHELDRLFELLSEMDSNGF